MKNKFLKMCSVFLVMVLLFNMLPHRALADMLSGEESALTPDSSAAGELQDISATEEIPATENVTFQQFDASDAVVLGEVTEKRTEYSKEFRLSNGLHLTALYESPVHYEDGGQWKEIDNTLVLKADGTVTNTAGVWDVSFPQQLSAGKYVTVTKDGYTLRFGMGGVLSSSGTAVMRAGTAFSVQQAQLSAAQVQQLDTAASSAKHPETVAAKLNSRLQYSNVYANTNVVYDLQSNKLKESVIISRYDSSLRGYRYTLDVGKLIPVLQEDNSVWFYDEARENVVMVMPAPFMVDADKAYSYDVDVILQGSGSSYSLQYILPQQWLAAEDRAWPVVLDPMVSSDATTSNVQDVTVAQGVDYAETTGTILCGYSSADGKIRTYLKYKTLPQLTSADVIVQANIKLVMETGSTDQCPVEVHKVTDTWPTSALSWNNAPAFEDAVEDFSLVNQSGNYYWDITNIVRGWYEGENTGMVFKVPATMENAHTERFLEFNSSDASTGVPSLTVYFRNANGLEDYWDYTESSAGRAGTGYVNNYTGNLVWVREDMGFGGNLMPVTISHIYNLNDVLKPADNNNANDSNANATFGMGIGWRINFNQRIFHWQLNGQYIGWEDGDGTDHYFKYKSAGVYEDEDGLELTLTNTGTGDTKYCITDKLGNCSYFDAYGRLTKQSNNQEIKSHIMVAYEGTSYRISRITDGANRKYNFSYTNNLLSQIVYTGSGEDSIHTVSFSYENNKLTAITDADNKTCRYYYTTNGVLTSVKNIDDYKLEYDYNTPTQTYQPYRVQQVTESDYSETEAVWVEGSSFSFDYDQNQTTITDHDYNEQFIQFNNWGDMTGIYDDEGRGQFFRYTTDSDPDGTPHQLRRASDLQSTVVNIFDDSSFENSAHNWVNTANTNDAYMDPAVSDYGNYALWVEAGAAGAGVHEGTYTLAAGESITFSAYVKSETAAVSVMLFNWGDNPESKRVTTGSQWERLEVSYTNNTGANQNVSPHILAWDSGLFLVDGVQLEMAPTASRYNLVDNGDFNADCSYAWDKIDGYTQTTVSAFSQLNNNVYSLSGSYTGKNCIKQLVNINGNMDDTFVLAGWGKGNAIPFDMFMGGTYVNERGRAFGLRARFVYDAAIDSYSPYFGVDFNPSVENWQYAATQIEAEQSYTAIEISLVYDYGANDVYFDGIQLYTGNIGTTYSYYNSNNKLASVTEADGNKTQYTYDDLDRLESVLEPSGVYTTYEYYGNYHNIKKKIVDTSDSVMENIRTVHEYTYDAYGNQLSSTSSSNGTPAMTSTATYSSDYNRLTRTTDTAGNTTRYGYDAETNVLNWVQYPEDTEFTRTNYTYNTMFRLKFIRVCTETVDGSYDESFVEYLYSSDRLTGILTPSSEYTIEYTDEFEQRQSVSVGEHTLADYTYTNDANRRLSSIDFQNGDMVYYYYDAKGRPIKDVFSNGNVADTVAYIYDSKDNLVRMTDSRSGITTSYYYDEFGRQTEYVEKGTNFNHSVSCTYDQIGNPWLIEENINGTSYNTEYIYDVRSRVNEIIAQVSDTDAVNTVYHYDELDRVLYQYIRVGQYGEDGQFDRINSDSVFYKSFTYALPTGDDRDTTHRVKTCKITIPGRNATTTYTYDYDKNGNILSVSDGTHTTSYVYDSLNQLIRENNQAGGYTYTWEYDTGGNILCRRKYAYTTGSLGTPTATTTYSYESEDGWGDLLTAYNGQTITYSNGYLLNDGTWSYAWTHGTQLSKMYTAGNAKVYTFTYNADGLRTRRTVNETGTTLTYKYVYNGSQLSQMTFGTHKLQFTYDAEGTPLTLVFNGTTYYYVTNVQGDVVALLDSSGSEVVRYVYDAWGNVLNYASIDSGTVGSLNPLRYRGYVYDTETKLYYLQSRYYNPKWGRFITADGQISGVGGNVLGYNMFAYCMNNPVNMSDPDGNWPKWLTGALNIVSGMMQAAIGATLIATTGWTGVGGAVGTFLMVNGSATIAQGVGQVVNDASNKSVLREDNIVRTSVVSVGQSIGGNTGEKIAGVTYDAAVIASSMYAGKISLEESMPKIIKSRVFSANNGYGFKLGKNIEILYRNPNAAGGLGGTIFSYKGPLGKFRIDWDPVHRFHCHPPGH